MPGDVSTKQRGELLTDRDRAALRCARCGGRLRPHALWFDEMYDGRDGRAERAAAAGATLIDVNPENNPFGDLADRTGGAPATDALPALVERIIAAWGLCRRPSVLAWWYRIRRRCRCLATAFALT